MGTVDVAVAAPEIQVPDRRKKTTSDTDMGVE